MFLKLPDRVMLPKLITKHMEQKENNKTFADIREVKIPQRTTFDGL